MNAHAPLLCFDATSYRTKNTKEPRRRKALEKMERVSEIGADVFPYTMH
jgi:hypothetical protein